VPHPQSAVASFVLAYVCCSTLRDGSHGAANLAAANQSMLMLLAESPEMPPHECDGSHAKYWKGVKFLNIRPEKTTVAALQDTATSPQRVPSITDTRMPLKAWRNQRGEHSCESAWLTCGAVPCVLLPPPPSIWEAMVEDEG
jgi:hypothetical protein